VKTSPPSTSACDNTAGQAATCSIGSTPIACGKAVGLLTIHGDK